MKNLTDQDLLREYARSRSESAFRELVGRHVDHVYSAAVRLLVDRNLAEDAVQDVFVALANNATKLQDRVVISGWLHRTTHNTAVMIIRSEERRRAREKMAASEYSMETQHPSLTNDTDPTRIAPHIDKAVAHLPENDRDAITLRYFERKSGREMANLLGVSEEAAQKRVTRAVSRLKGLLAAQGIKTPLAVLTATLSANLVQAAPATLSAVVINHVAATGLIASTETAGWLSFKTWLAAAKAKPLAATLATLAVVSLGGSGFVAGRAAATQHWTAQSWQQAVLSSPAPTATVQRPNPDVNVGEMPSTPQVANEPNGPTVDEIFSEAAAHYRNSANDPEANSKAYVTMAALQPTDAGEARRLLEQYRSEPAVYRKLFPNVMNLWAKTEPELAMNFALEQADHVGSSLPLTVQMVSQTWAQSDPPSAWNWYNTRTESRDIPIGEGSWMWVPKGIFSEWVTTDPQAAFEQYEDIPFSDRGNVAFGIADAVMEPDHRELILEEVDNLSNEVDRRYVARKIASQWASMEPQAAAEWAANLKFENSMFQLHVMGEVAEEWWQLDPHATTQWLLRNTPVNLMDQVAEMLNNAPQPQAQP